MFIICVLVVDKCCNYWLKHAKLYSSAVVVSFNNKKFLTIHFVWDIKFITTKKCINKYMHRCCYGSSKNSALELLLGQGAEWKIQTENQRKEWKILTYFIHPSFSIRHNRLNIGHRWHQSPDVFHIAYLSYLLVSAIQRWKLKEHHENSDCNISHHVGGWETIL